MTVWLRYTLTPEAPISAGRSGQVQNAKRVHAVLPGTAVRGALGSAWWHDHDDTSQDTFTATFERHLRVHTAVPYATAAGHDEEQAVLHLLSRVRCKYPPVDAPNPWRDQAAATPASCGHEECLGTPETARGWDVPPSWSGASTRTQLEGGVAKNQQLFTRTHVQSTIAYEGYLRIDDATDHEVLTWLQESRRLFIGGQLSTLGRCQWSCQSVEAPFASPPGDRTVVRTLSPTILLDDFGAPSFDLEAAIQAVAAGVGCDVTVERTWTRPVTVSGWHGRAGIPKPEDWALLEGSVAVVTGLTEAAKLALLDGLGIRRNEGYGVVELRADVDLSPFTGRAAVTTSRDASKDATSPAERGVQPSSIEPDPAAPPATVVAPAGDNQPVAAEVASPASEGGKTPTETRTPARVALDALLEGLLADDQRSVATGMLGRARDVEKLRASRFPDHIIKARIDQAFRLPWSIPVRGRTDELVAVLTFTPADEMISELTHWLEDAR